jgi:hypothetical protein
VSNEMLDYYIIEKIAVLLLILFCYIPAS